jgi:hypothetical protein
VCVCGPVGFSQRGRKTEKLLWAVSNTNIQYTHTHYCLCVCVFGFWHFFFEETADGGSSTLWANQNHIVGYRTFLGQVLHRMGGGGSNARYMNGNQDEIVAIMMPVYYIHDAVVTQNDLKEATTTWTMITDDTSEEFKRRKANDPDFTHFSCVSWFFNNFYSRLFDVHPLCRSLFTSGLQSQGKFLIKMVSLTLSQLGDQVVFIKRISWHPLLTFDFRINSISLCLSLP